ncbi:hypothetical protein LLH00_09800 [bacterium]|nr:hypothetical protein [bacterium]
MKTIKLTTAAALFLLLVGVAPYRSLELRINQQSMGFLMPSGMAAAGETDSLAGGATGESRLAEDLSEGAKLLSQKCSVCHSVNFVFKSGMLAGEIDSTLACMQKKSRNLLSSRERDDIRLYLASRLPRE